MPNEKKRHHYIPVSYLKGFNDKIGRIFAYRKDNPETPLYVRPDEIAFERYYYSQPLPDNEQDNNALEDLFSTIETSWPTVVEGLRNVETSTHESLSQFFDFLGLMRVRIPAMRDAVEAMLAESVKATSRQLNRMGKLPPLPLELESIDLWNNLVVSIDPHKSIHAMPQLLHGFSKIVDSLGFGVVHCDTVGTFITSDNPVAYFNPDTLDDLIQPYQVNPHGGRIELLFPISPQMLILGRTEWKFQFSASGIRHYELRDKHELKRINRLLARFGYRFIFASDTTHGALVKKYAGISPVLETQGFQVGDSEVVRFRSVFGARAKLPKWVRPANQTFGPQDQLPPNRGL